MPLPIGGYILFKSPSPVSLGLVWLGIPDVCLHRLQNFSVSWVGFCNGVYLSRLKTLWGRDLVEPGPRRGRSEQMSRGRNQKHVTASTFPQKVTVGQSSSLALEIGGGPCPGNCHVCIRTTTPPTRVEGGVWKSRFLGTSVSLHKCTNKVRAAWGLPLSRGHKETSGIGEFPDSSPYRKDLLI